MFYMSRQRRRITALFTAFPDAHLDADTIHRIVGGSRANLKRNLVILCKANMIFIRYRKLPSGATGEVFGHILSKRVWY